MQHNQSSKMQFQFLLKVTATFSTMEQVTEQLQNERQATQDTPLKGPSLLAEQFYVNKISLIAWPSLSLWFKFLAPGHFLT